MAIGPHASEDAPGSHNGGDPDSGQGVGVERAPTGKLGGPDGLLTLAASGREHVAPYGARDKFSRGVQALVARTGDDIRSALADPETVKDYLDALRAGLKARDRTCIINYGKVMKLVDAERTVIVEVLHQLGMDSVEELERVVGRHKDAARISPEQRAAVCGDYLELYLNAHPEERQAFVRRLGGEVPVTSASYAIVKED